ncbi:MAG: hypothetical protein GY851_28575 [bacterium]|nr:hypothetical protein [bacterium]
MTMISVNRVRPNWFRTQWRTRPDRVWFTLILALGFVLRIVRLGSRDYWHDEVHMLVKMERFSDVLQGNYVSNHPPLFTFLGVIWQSIGLGDTEWTMRLLPLLLGLGSIAAVFLVARYLFGVRAGLFAAFLVAVSPLHVFHSQDLKDYMILPLTAPIMVYALCRAVDGNRPIQWAAYAIMAAAACYSDFFAGPLLIAVNLWFVWRAWGRWERWPGWLVANIAGALLFVPYLRVTLWKSRSIMVEATDWWVHKPTLMSALFYLKSLAFGYSDFDPAFKAAMCLFGIVAAAGAIVAWRRNRSAAVLVVLWCFLPVGLVFVMSHVFNSIFLVRSMIPYALALYVLVGVGLAALPNAAFRVVGVAVFAAAAAVPIYQHCHDQYPPHSWPHRPGVHPPGEYRAAAEYVRSRFQPGDLVVHSCEVSWLPFYWYGFKDLRVQRTVSTYMAFLRTWHGANVRVSQHADFDGYLLSEIQSTVAGHNRVWLVFSGWERSMLPGPPASVWRWMDAHYPEVDHARFEGLEVYLYQKSRRGDSVELARRDFDGGLGATLTYRGGLMANHVTIPPDVGLSPRFFDERRGALLLRFDEERAPGNASARDASADGEQARMVTFSIENRSDQPVSCDVELVESDVLVPLASLMETHPESDKWRVVSRHNPTPPPGSHQLRVMAAAMPEATPEAALTGTVKVMPGTYATLLNTVGSPLSVASARGDLRVMVGNTDVASPLPRRQGDIDGWHWFSGAPVTVTGSYTGLPIRVTATPLPGAEQSYVDLGYLALVTNPQTPTPQAGAVMEPWPGALEIPAGATQHFAADIPVNRKRVDVWVYERGEDGRGYHIFRRWDKHRN